MYKVTRERRELQPRHDLDGLLPCPDIIADPATPEQMAGLAYIANKEVPGIHMSAAGLSQFLQHDPESIFAFQRAGKLLGGVAFLYLNCLGHDALLLDEIDLKNPGREFLARPGEEVSAIYTWAVAGYGRAVVGLGNVANYQKKPRFLGADYFAQPNTADGRDLLRALGFKPIASFQPDLWSYPRPRRIDMSGMIPIETTAGATQHGSL